MDGLIKIILQKFNWLNPGIIEVRLFMQLILLVYAEMGIAILEGSGCAQSGS